MAGAVRRWPLARPGVVVGVRLSRNFGQHNALIAGLRHARYDVSVTIDDDLQNPPEEIPRLLACLEEEHLDVVYGVPTNVEQSLWRRMSGRMTRRAMRTVLGMKNAPDVSSFRAFRTRLRDAFSGNLGTNVALDALLSWGTTQIRLDPCRRTRREPRAPRTTRSASSCGSPWTRPPGTPPSRCRSPASPA